MTPEKERTRWNFFFSRGIRDIVFGVQDGLVSTLGVLTGIAKGTGDAGIVMISGLVVVAVESLSMAAGSYLSSKSQRQFQENLLEREREQIRTDIGNEEREISDMYGARGYSREEIGIIKKRLLSDKDLLLEDMAHKELGIVPSRMENPLLNAGFMGISYVVGGCLPVLPYFFTENLRQGMTASFAATLAGLFGLGAAKGVLFKVSWLRSGLEIVFVAGFAALLGYLIGAAMSATPPSS